MSGYKDRDIEKYDKFVRNSTANNDMLDQWPQEEEIVEAVNHPEHYKSKDNTYEAINVIEAWGLNFHCGNVVKYIARHKQKKNAKQDIEKAIWYLERYLESL